jgi:carbon-monoxide dehydrogenase medium subunit
MRKDLQICERYFSPSSVDHALDLLDEWKGQARIISGGTDLTLAILERRWSSEVCLIDVTRIPDLDVISLDNGMIRIGPLVTHSQAVSSNILIEKAFALPKACSQVGSTQIRNCATIAGNLAFASPAGDTIPPLWSLDATITLASRARGQRELTFPEFFLGVQRTALQPDEMIVSIQFPFMKPEERGTFLKLGLRKAQAIALVNVAVVLGVDGERISNASIALGSVGPTIIRANEAEEYLLGQSLDKDVIAKAGDLSAAAAQPIDDIRGSADYRRAMVKVLTIRALQQLRDGEERQDWPEHPASFNKNREQDLKFRETSCSGNQSPDDIIEFGLNGKPVNLRERHRKSLLQVLREDLNLTGTKEGCSEGECGACTILLDGEPVLSCLLPAMKAHNRKVITIEGVATDEDSHSLLQSFVREGAVQCGYCIPGAVMSTRGLLNRNPCPSEVEIREALSGNLCRCGNYLKIINAIRMAVK